MKLSDISVTRPVFATVISLLLIAFGVVAFQRLPLREYPDIDPPVVSIDTTYPGAAANVVETRITQVIEDRISGVEGIQFIESRSQDGRSDISVEFSVDRDIDSAANDIRDRVSRIADNLPDQAEPPEVQKVGSDDDVIMWLNLTSDRMSVPELSDYAERYLKDRFSVLDGVARVRVGGAQPWAMRIWLDRKALAARGLTSADVERALRSENVELPAGSVESEERVFTVRVQRTFKEPEQFRSLVIGRGDDGYLIRLGDVADVQKAPREERTFFRGNLTPMVGIGVTKQSTANTIEVARAANAEMARLNPLLPEGMSIKQSYDTSVFIEEAISEVYKTLGIAIVLVVLVIFVFLGSGRAMLVPAVTVPVSLIATFIALFVLGFSINLLTLLALVLAIGLVVDDAIVVLENIVRRIQEKGETPLVAAYYGTRQVGFAVIATTLVLVAVFVPIAFLEGDVGRLFSEFALTMAAAVCFSSLIALSLSPMLASKVLTHSAGATRGRLNVIVDSAVQKTQVFYKRWLEASMRRPLWIGGIFLVVVAATVGVFALLPNEYAPKEDRGAFFVLVNGPEGASYDYIEEYMNEVEARIYPYVEKDEISRMLVRAPRAWGNIASFNSGIVICVLNDWADRRPVWPIMNEIRQSLGDLPGVRAFPIMRQGFGGGLGKPVQFVIGGGTYEELTDWRDLLLAKINEDNPGLTDIDWDYKETKPQIEVNIDYDRAAQLGVSVSGIGTTLQTMLGSRRVTTFVDGGEEYDVLLEGNRDQQNTPTDIDGIYVRSETSGRLIPLSNIVHLTEYADSPTLNRYNRVRAITIEANLSDELALGEALDYLRDTARDTLPAQAIIDYKGQSLDYQRSGGSIWFVFVLGIVVVFLVLSAQFESFVHPFVIMLTVPLAIFGGLFGLLVTGGSLNIYSQIGLIMLVGLAAKNGILIVEFANQLRDEGYAFDDALVRASLVRLRPILMTSLTTAAGSVPLILSFGAGAETRMVIGVVVLFGVLASTFLTLFVVPTAYGLIARKTRSPKAVKQQLEREAGSNGHAIDAPAAQAD